jgi:hypothetical protein
MSAATRRERKDAEAEARQPKRQARDPKTYNLPPAIGAAVSSNRAVFCEYFATALEAAAAEVKEPQVVQPLQVADMARLIGDLLEDRASRMLVIHDLQTKLKNVHRQVTSFQAALEDAVGHDHGEDLEDDDLDEVLGGQEP